MVEDTRRTFVKKAIRLTATALGMAAAVLGGHALLRGRRPRYPANRAKFGPRGVRLIRPPGAVGEREVLAGCIRCYRCQDACHETTLHRHELAGAIRVFQQGCEDISERTTIEPAPQSVECRREIHVQLTNGLDAAMRMHDYIDRVE